MHLCSVCGQDRERDLTRERVALHARGIVEEHMDPGGRLLVFADGTTLRLDEQCNSCDAARIQAFLQEKGATC